MEQQRKLLAKRVQQLRERLGLTQEELAERVNRTTNHISKIETAKANPSFELLVNISQELNVDLKELFNFDEFQNLPKIKKDFENLLKSDDEAYLRLLYKLHRNLYY